MTSAAAPSEIELELAAVTVPSLRNAGLSVGIFSRLALNGCSSVSMNFSSLPALMAIGVDFPGEPAVLVRVLRALERGDGELVLRFAREASTSRAILGEGAHQAALVVGVLEAVVEHVVDHLAVAHAQAAARFRQQVRRVGHRLHAARDDDVGLPVARMSCASIAAFIPEPHILFTVVQPARERQAGAERRLARRRLALAGRQHAAHDHFLHVVGADLRALDCGADRGGAELGRGEALELALEGAHRRAGGGDDDDRIGLHGHSFISAALGAQRGNGLLLEGSNQLGGGHATRERSAWPAQSGDEVGLAGLRRAARSLPVTLFCAGNASCGLSRHLVHEAVDEPARRLAGEFLGDARVVFLAPRAGRPCALARRRSPGRG